MKFNFYSQIDSNKNYFISWTKPKIIIGTGGYFDSWSLISMNDVRTYYYTDDRSEITSNLTSYYNNTKTDKESLKDALRLLAQSARDIKLKKIPRIIIK